ncbi:hypothetical protein SDC9_143521 [bioreactor metagenome]|uniref:Uncharacterized protein n=1 Tax=bioreactor metagenome TaxID=1076179 RepID=A0A645E3M4_9ZZZZ
MVLSVTFVSGSGNKSIADSLSHKSDIVLEISASIMSAEISAHTHTNNHRHV